MRATKSTVSATAMMPSTRPAVAIPRPVSAPPDWSIFLRERMPRMIAAMPVNPPRHITKLTIPQTSDATAMPSVRA